MVETAIVNRPEDLALTANDVKTYICPAASDHEVAEFLRICVRVRLDPFLKQIFLVKYGQQPAAIVIGLSAYLIWADQNPNYQGYQSGVVVSDANGDVQRREGSATFPGDTLVGGWATGRRKDWAEPQTSTVALEEYDLGQALWNKKKGTMIEKVAVVQLLRRMFPDEVNKKQEELGSVTVEVIDDDDMPAIDQSKVIDNVPAVLTGPKAGDHPLLQVCPVHDIAWVWRDGERNRPGWWSHPKPEGETGFCQQTGILSDVIRAECKKLQPPVTQDGLNAWLKGIYDGRTMSALTPEEKVAVIEALPEHFASTAPVPAPVDTTTTSDGEAPPASTSSQDGPVSGVDESQGEGYVEPDDDAKQLGLGG